MPIYVYRCEVCKQEEEASVSVEKRNDTRLHSCGRAMKRLFTPQPFQFKLTGRGMALDTLNSGQALPNRWYKDKYEKMAASGL